MSETVQPKKMSMSVTHRMCTVILFFALATLLGCETQWDATGPTVLAVTADGVQTYSCEVGAEGVLEWKFHGPRAELFDDGHHKVGTHSKSDAGPQWEILGDTIVGTKTHERASGRAGAIPELQLSGRCTGTGTTFGNVVMIERLDTEGGVAPAIDGRKAGDEANVPYKARYVFHSAKP